MREIRVFVFILFLTLSTGIPTLRFQSLRHKAKRDVQTCISIPNGQCVSDENECAEPSALNTEYDCDLGTFCCISAESSNPPEEPANDAENAGIEAGNEALGGNEAGNEAGESVSDGQGVDQSVYSPSHPAPGADGQDGAGEGSQSNVEGGETDQSGQSDQNVDQSDQTAQSGQNAAAAGAEAAGAEVAGAEAAGAEAAAAEEVSEKQSAPAADPVTTDDPQAHTAIWFHGMQGPACGNDFCGCRNLKAYIHYPGRTDVITPISSTDHGGATGSPASGGLCHIWGPREEPFGLPLPTTNQLTVSGYSAGRIPLFRFIKNHGDSLNRAVLFDPSYESETYDGKKGFEVVADWLRGDSTRAFVFAYGGATLSLGISNWKHFFLDSSDNESLRQQIWVVHNTHLLHYQIPSEYYNCLFDNTCGGRANHDYSLQNYRT